MTRAQKWLVGIAVFVVLLITFFYFFNWNLLKPYVERRVSAATGRTFAINGDLDVHLSLRPRVIANQMVLSNAPWSKDPNMAEMGRLNVRVDLIKLLFGNLTIYELDFADGYLLLEVNKDGARNWVFKEERNDEPIQIPDIQALSIDRGRVTFRDPRINTDVSLNVNTVASGKDDGEPMVEVSGKGRYKGVAATLNGRGGALLTLRDATRPYPIKLNVAAGSTKASIDGVLLDPLRFKGQQVNFRLEGADMAQLYPLVGVPLPPTPAYKLAGFLDHEGDLWKFSKFKGSVGKSDLAGDFSVDRGKQPQLITANLVSRNLDMNDLGGFIGADRGERPADKPPPSDKLLPTEPFSLEKLRAANVDVRFQGARIMTTKTPLEKMNAHLIIRDGTVKLAPLDFGVAGGNLVSQIEMDARKPKIATRADITVKGLHLGQLFPESKIAAEQTGTMGGRAKLDTTGNSVSQMMGSANGDAALIMDGGSVSELLLRLSNLDIANAVMVWLGGDKQVPIHCMVANFKAVNGTFNVDALVLDTPKVNVTGEGHVNFANETLNLRLVSQQKGFSLASLRGPIVITGTLKDPNVRPELGKAAVRGVLAAALGAVTAGIGALIPLLDPGKKKDSNCAALMAEAKADTGVKASDLKPRPQSKR